MELVSDLVLLDDASGRTEALRRGLPITGTLGVLEQAARRGMIDLADAFQKLKTTDFRGKHLMDPQLQKFLAWKAAQPPAS